MSTIELRLEKLTGDLIEDKRKITDVLLLLMPETMWEMVHNSSDLKKWTAFYEGIYMVAQAIKKG